MPAASFKELFKFRENFIAAQKSVLLADVAELIGADTEADPDRFVFGEREATGESAPFNRIDVGASVFSQASNQQVYSAATGDAFFCHYAGTLSFTVITPRGEDGANAEHENRVGRIMFLMQPKAACFNADNLPHYEILLLTLSSLPETVQDPETGTDRTAITYGVQVWIKPDAFPAVVD